MSDRCLTLVLGGTRSGKSSFAQRLALERGVNVLFVATAEPGDAEMAVRISKHREERSDVWRTIEEPKGVARAISAAGPTHIVLLDCVTLWVSNLLLETGSTFEGALSELEALLSWYHANKAELIVVSNEVGLGIVPADEVSRAYTDWLGRFNQRLAAEADAVYFMIAGMPVELKSLVGARPSRPA